MALFFPTEPEPNEIYNQGNRSWKWNGRFWEAVSTTIGYAGSSGYAGSRGFTGSRGRDGFTGSLGYSGSQGFTGSQGITGYWGSVGYVGSKGLSAYEVAVANGFVGTEPQWLLSITPPSIIPTANTGVIISNNTLTTIYNTLVPNTTISIAIGGASALAASTWKTKSIVEVLDTILFPDQAPTYTNPSITLQGSVTGTREVGDTYSQSLSLTVIKNDAGPASGLQITKNGSVITATTPTSQGATDVPANFPGLPDPNNPNYYYRITALESNIIVTSGSVSWAGSAVKTDGLPKPNNKGVIATTGYITAGSLNSNVITVTGIYPWFWGVSSAASLSASTVATTIQAGTSNKNLAEANGTISITFNASSQFLWFALPAGYANKTGWLNVGNATNTGGIGGLVTDPANLKQFILAPVTINVTSPTQPTPLWSNVSYKIYISAYQQTTNGIYQFY